MGSLSRRHMILYPYGLPATGSTEACGRLILALGGDVNRVLDGPFADLEKFVGYVRRIPMLREGAPPEERPIVVFTRTNPIGLCVLKARRTIELAVPTLRRAIWSLFVDPSEDPFFLENARRLGDLDEPLGGMPIWRTFDGGAYLVLSAEARALGELRGPVRQLIETGV